MNHNEEVPDFLGGHGDLLPADVLKMVNELLEQLHRKEKDHQGSPVFIYAPGAQYVNHIDTQIFGERQQQKDTSPAAPVKDTPLSPELSTPKAMALWQKAQAKGYVDANYQPLISRTQAALLADAMAERLGIRKKWKVFETLWNRKNMYRDYYKALNLHQSLTFQDKIKRLFR